MASTMTDWCDARLQAPLELKRTYGSWTLTIKEQRDCDDDNLIHGYEWHLYSNSQRKDYASGRAPTLEAAKRALEHLLVDYCIKTPLAEGRSGEDPPMRGRVILPRTGSSK